MNWILSLIVIVLISPVYMVAVADDSVIGFYEQRDLELIGSPNQVNAQDRRHSGFVSSIDRTILPHGRKALEQLIAHPIADIHRLLERQSIVSYFSKDIHRKDLVNTVDRLAVMSKNLNGLQQLNMLREDKVAQLAMKKFYYQWDRLKGLNRSGRALDAKHIVSVFFGPAFPIIELVVFHWALEALEKRKNAPPAVPSATPHVQPSHDDGHGHSHGGVPCNHNHPAPADVASAVPHVHGAGCGHSHGITQRDYNDAVANPTLLNGTVLGLKAFNYIYHPLAAYEGLLEVQERLSMLDSLYKSLVSLKAILLSCKQLQHEAQAILNAHGIKAVEGSEYVLFPESLVKELDGLLKVFNTPYFKANSGISWYSSVGQTLLAYKLYEQKRPVIEELLNRVGKLDAFMSMATVVKELQGKDNALCFVDFTQSLYDAKGLWNPMLSADSAVANDLHFDESSPSHIVLTGPNKAGKSSLLKAAAIASVLTQVFGVAPAKSASMPIFSKIITFMTVLDDISNDQSSLVARILRADNVTQTIKKLAPDQKALVLLDDSVGQGTTAVRGLQAATELFTTVGASANTIMIGATHYTELSNLAALMPTAFANWRIRINADSEGTKASSFTLEPGVCPAESVYDLVEAQGYFSEQKVS